MSTDLRQILFTLLDPEHFETMERHRPSGEFLARLAPLAEAGWEVRPGGFWTHCTPPGHVPLEQGWKIHLSATPATAEETLRRALPVLREEGAAFKVCADPWALRISTAKNWPRESAGKFVAVYPGGEAHFLRLACRLHEATADLQGPYVLSDRPYRDSRVVFYRWGGHRTPVRVDAQGRHRAYVTAPDGTPVPDERVPFFRLPPWVRDPLPAGNAPAEEALLNGRFRPTAALRFSVAGGLYRGIDTRTGREVVLREARPHVAPLSGGGDARTLLEKSARVLRRMAGTGWAPEPVDLFVAWEHLFLAEEQVPGKTLWMEMIERTRALSPTARPSPAEHLAILRDVVGQVAEGMAAFHARGIVLRDATKTNVLVTPEGRVRFVDFELAYEMDSGEPPVAGYTAGYASPAQRAGETPSPADDHYALGALLLDVVCHNAAAHPLNPRGALATLSLTLADLGLPPSVRTAVEGLMAPDARTRWTPERALEALAGARGLSVARPVRAAAAAPGAGLVGEVRETVAGVARYLAGAMDLERRDRLWPASPEVFTTHPLGLQYGAAGTAAFLLRAVGEVPPPVLAWLGRGVREHAAAPPGLYNGLAGVGVLLVEAGRVEEGLALLDRTAKDGRRWEEAGLFDGAAGWGLAHLHAWGRTGEARLLDRAGEAGAWLLSAAREEEAGLFWEQGGKAPHGLGHGAAGVGLFLAFLHAARPEGRVLAAAARALEWEAAHAQRRHGLLNWTETRGGGGPHLPHVRYGTAGVGQAALRLFAATGEERFRALAVEAGEMVSHRLANKLWQDFGLAGYGELLLDLYRFLGEERWLREAFAVAEALVCVRIPRGGGFAFAGLDGLRISCDFGMGAAGIGHFLHRLLNPSLPHLLFPDALLLGVSAGVGVASAGERGLLRLACASDGWCPGG